MDEKTTSVQRNLQEKITRLLALFPAVAIIGARQVGKTTLAKAIAPDWTYLDLENPNDWQRIHDDPLLFFKQYPEKVIIDEAQMNSSLFKVLRGVIDANRNQYGRFLITGSSSPDLLKHISESLAGRLAIVELGTLKANEYYNKPYSEFYELFNNPLDRNNLISGAAPLSNQEMQLHWLKGGYPEPSLSIDPLKNKLWYEQYYDTYIHRDLSSLFPKLNRINYQRFIYLLAKLSGTILNRAELGRTLEIDEGTVRNYIKIADGTFIWRELLSYNKQVSKSIIKMPKGHLRDSGLLHYLLHLNQFDALFRDPIAGHSFESFVIEEIIKGLDASFVSNWNPYYYRTRAGAEIDLILEGPFGILPIEIKYSLNIKLRQLTALTHFIEENKLPFGLLINPCEMPYWLTDKIVQIPVGWI